MTTINPIQYSNLAKGLSYLRNPNSQGGTLLIEVPADIGKAYNGYKRGGIVEGAEKLRKEVLSAIVWLFGIPLFNKTGNFIFEKAFKLPMNMDYSKEVIERSVEFLQNNKADAKGLNASELTKYGEQYIKKIKELGVDKSVKKIKGAKQVITISAWILNCVLMGIVLPKLNQRITRNKLNKENKQQENLKNRLTMEEFQKKSQKNNQPSFKGGFGNFIDSFAYGINTNNTVRLVSTDVPMIIGRCATARNKYEALEIGLMDSAAIFFYNFSLGLIEKGLSKVFGTPIIDSKVAEIIAQQDEATLNSAIQAVKNENEVFELKNIFSKGAVENIYKEATNGKYGKINRFVDGSELDNIDGSIKQLLQHINKKEIYKNGEIDTNKVKEIIKKINNKNCLGYAMGIIGSVIGLGWIIPKVAYFITRKITGKSGFVGVEENGKK